MKAEFWHERWRLNEIGFHASSVNPWLRRYLDALALTAGARVFIPLCGKTVDIGWLLEQGYRVAGAELNESAVQQLFSELKIEPTVETTTTGKIYRGPHLDVYVGDIFDLTAQTLGPVDASFDRAALVALPPDMRARYTQHLVQLSQTAPQLLVSFNYDQTVMDGPPFAVLANEIHSHYQHHYKITQLERSKLEGGLKGKCEAFEEVWLLVCQ
jgi:thiopurine S-methyltransferase